MIFPLSLDERDWIPQGVEGWKPASLDRWTFNVVAAQLLGAQLGVSPQMDMTRGALALLTQVITVPGAAGDQMMADDSIAVEA